MTNPEVVKFYSKVTSFQKIAECYTTNFKETNHLRVPTHYPLLMEKVTPDALAIVNTNRTV